MASTPPLLQVRGISKAFPGVQALADVSFAIQPGEILAVVGENGAGKSTLMKIIAGLERPDAGEIRLDGQKLALRGVHDAEKHGIVLIHQELNLADNLDVAGNIFLGREPTWGGPLRFISRSIYPASSAILRRLGLGVSPRKRLGELPIGQQQVVEIARALSLRSRILIMDEPTSSLTQTETDRLFAVIRELKAAGVAIFYISHRLPEVKALADRAVVLRDGRNSGELYQAEINSDSLVRLMVGRDLKQLHQRQNRPALSTVEDPNRSSVSAFAPASDPRPLMRVQNLRWSPDQVRGVSFDVRAGEIVCLAGLVGAGRTELAEALLGLRPALGGLIELHGKNIALNRLQDSLQAGLFLVPEDRRRQGLILSDSVRRNISLPSLGRLQRMGLVAFRSERRLAQEMRDKLAIRTPSLGQRVGLLSGGNQQKVVLAKGLARQPRLLILDEPTRGVDVGAKAEIYAIMDKLAGEGVGILMISSDLEEVLGMSDRVLVMHEGQVAGELNRDRLTEEAVMKLATGGNTVGEKRA